MPFVACPCGKKFRATDALAGKQVNCPGCGRPLLIPQASLLDEELARPSRPSSAAAPLPRSRVGDRSIQMEGWLLALLVIGGGAVVLVIVVTMMSMFSGSGPARPDGGSAISTADEPAVSDTASGGASSQSADSPNHRQAELESRSPTDAAALDSAAPAADTSATQAFPEPAPQSPPPPVAKRDEPRPSKPAQPGGSPTRPTADTIRLSTGVALAQTLPTGTAMGFSVEYEFVNHAPSGTANLIWVIESGNGKAVRQRVQMAARGTLEGFVPQFRPEDGPFNTYIEDGSGNQLSKSLPLR